MTESPSFHRVHSSAGAAATIAVLALPIALAACGTNLASNVVDVSGRAFETVETGRGDVTVVFEAGFGNDWSVWDAVATEVAEDARVFAYSRPGYGRSPLTTEPRDAEHIVEDLRMLLTSRGYAPPYILVGHSFGGTYMELFAKKYPAQVRGLVLVDTRHRGFARACDDAGVSGCVIPEHVVPSLPTVQVAEYRGFALAFDQIDAAGGFGSYPVRVLTATQHGFSDDAESLWVAMQSALAAEAPNGEQRIFAGANHYLAAGHPREVAETIRSLLPSSR